MKHVRFIDHLVDPSSFRRGHGLTGWLVSVLNLVRLWAEYLICLYVAKHQGYRDRSALKFDVFHGTYWLSEAVRHYQQPMLVDGEPFRAALNAPAPEPVFGMSLEQHAAKAAGGRAGREAAYQRGRSKIHVYDGDALV